MRTAALIVAAGRGNRAGGDVPKQWRMLLGRTVLSHTLAAFVDHPAVDCVVLVLHCDDLDRITPQDGLIVTKGGAERSASVKAGLNALPKDIDKVLIHDVARPCISATTITQVIDALDENMAVAPALPVTDALWTGVDERVTGTQDRSGLFRAQTPQGFHRDAIVAAHAAFPGNAADDVEVARAAGISVAIVAGDEDNLKITLPADFGRAERILKDQHGH